MTYIKVGTACLNQTPLDWEGNRQRIMAALEAARAAGVDLLCLPELCITGYGCEDLFHSPEVCERAIDTLYQIASDSPINPVFCVGLPIIHNGALYNTVAVIQHNRVLGFVAKQHLAGDGIHYEPRWFKPWPEGVVKTLGNRHKPIGDLQFDFKGVKVGFEICEDAWVANRPGATLARKGVDIIMNPSASHFAIGKNTTRRRFVAEGARAFRVTYLYANLVGNEAGRAIYDGDCLIAGGSNGDILSEGPRFSFKDMELTTAVVDLSSTRVPRIGSASFTPDLSTTFIEGSHFEGTVEPLTRNADLKYWDDYEEFQEAEALGLWDYARKSHSKGYVISLSGGADSAACAYLVDYALQRAVATHGTDAVERMVGTNNLYDFLTCVYQSTENSSDTTFAAAETLSENIGCKFRELDVEDIVQAYVKGISKSLGLSLTWGSNDIALQNIQARVRAPSAWLIANLEGKLLITTSNRSEAAVGYCTMDGDTAGSIAPIAGVAKAFLLGWLRSEPVQKSYTSAALITAQKPTAELRPGSTQTDEDDLMPYDVLNAVETEAIENKRGPLVVYRRICELFPEAGPEKVLIWVEKFFHLWFRNQWKREKYSLSFQIDSRSLDPRTWCRAPILSAGYHEELSELRAFVEREEL